MRKCWPYKGGSLRELAVKFEDPICTRGSASDEKLAEEKTEMQCNAVDVNWAAFKPSRLRQYSRFHSTNFTCSSFIRIVPTYFKRRTISFVEYLLIRFEKGNESTTPRLQLDGKQYHICIISTRTSSDPLRGK
jgi:hypothetical protein